MTLAQKAAAWWGYAPDHDHAELNLEGRFDMHVHTAPDVIPRKFTDLQLVDQAVSVDAGGVVLKAHRGSTEARAALCNEFIERSFPGSLVKIFGSVVLNQDVGGLNPYKVDTVLKLGGKVVWLPTLDAENDLKHHGKPTDRAVTVLDEDGKPLPELMEILKMIADAQAVLATGHISPRESYAVIKAAREVGVNNIVVTHPEFWVVDMSLDQQRQLIDDFGVVMERVYKQPNQNGGDWLDNRATNLVAIKELGYKNTLISTDCGQPKNQEWNDSLMACLQYYFEGGVTLKELDYMSKELPARLLGM